MFSPIEVSYLPYVAYCLISISCSLYFSSRDSYQPPELFEFDHVHVDSNVGSLVAILYGALGTDCFRDFHFTLAEAAKEVLVLLYFMSLCLLSGI